MGNLRDLQERFTKAAVELDTMATQREPESYERTRLHGKAEGVRLARSYLEEMMRGDL